ncbi:MAG: class II SORL domain-containing protein [Candidatus Thermoplasmatota archaeon]|nr:class II SORL domain-containing protein [Candidatus Thermoplasmatota archaeon]
MKELFQTADWKSEKHVPAIEVLEKKEEEGKTRVTVRASVGKEIKHPNTTEHHIEWIELYFLPEGEKFPYQLGRFEFWAHGASAQGPNTSGVYAEPVANCTFLAQKSGKIYASSYCNIHGLWEGSEELKL